MYEELLFPGVIRDNWQMMECERIALTGVLARVRPQGALEIGVYYGGSLSLAAQFCQRILAIDIDPAVRDRFTLPPNAELWIGDSRELIPHALADFQKRQIPLEYVLIDAQHSSEGVRRDVNLVLRYRPVAPMVILIHDSGNADCRAGILRADWKSNPYVRVVQCDFVPGQIIGIPSATAGVKCGVGWHLPISIRSHVPASSLLPKGRQPRSVVRNFWRTICHCWAATRSRRILLNICLIEFWW